VFRENCGNPRGFKFLGPHGGFPGLGQLRHLLMGVDVEEGDKDLIVSVPLPGLTKDDFELTVGPNTMIITFKEKVTSGTKEAEDVKEEETGFKPWMFFSGRSFGGTRRFPLPTEVDPDTAKAKLENGILKVTVEKKNPGKRVSVE